MAAMTTVLTEFSDNGDSRTSTLVDHAFLVPHIVVEKRRVPVGNQVIAEKSTTIIKGMLDADGASIPQKTSMGITVKVPMNADPSTLSATLAAELLVLKDIVNGDEFSSSLLSQNWLTP